MMYKFKIETLSNFPENESLAFVSSCLNSCFAELKQSKCEIISSSFKDGTVLFTANVTFEEKDGKRSQKEYIKLEANLRSLVSAKLRKTKVFCSNKFIDYK